MSPKRIKPSIAEPSPTLPDVQVCTEPLAVSMETAALMAGVSRWTVKEAIMVGALKAKKCGRSNIILLADLQQWIASLDDVEPSTAPSIIARQEGRAAA